MKLSIAMIVKNEEKYLDDMLKAINDLHKHIEFEIVVVDTGSTDKSIDIAKKYTDKVYNYVWDDDFSKARNKSIEYCSGEWILVLDADEILVSIDPIVKFFNEKSYEKYKCGTINILNYKNSVNETLKNYNNTPIVRLFKNGYVKYEGRIHEQPLITMPVMSTNIDVIHYGYVKYDSELMDKKFKRNIDLLFQDIETSNNKAYTFYQISNSYHMYGKSEKALEYIEKAYNISNKESRAYILAAYCKICFDLRDYNKLEILSREGVKLEPEFLDFYYHLGNALYFKSQFAKCIDVYKKYLYFFDKYNGKVYTNNISLSLESLGFKDVVLFSLSKSLYKLKRYKEAIDNLMKIEEFLLKKEALLLFLECAIKSKLYSCFEFLDDNIEENNIECIVEYINDSINDEEILEIRKYISNKYLIEIVDIIYSYRFKNYISSEVEEKIKSNIIKTKKILPIFMYYLVGKSINNIDFLFENNRQDFNRSLNNLISKHFDFTNKVLEYMKSNLHLDIKNIVIKCELIKGLLSSDKITDIERKVIFEEYITISYLKLKYMYKEEYLESDLYLIDLYDKFILEVKNTLSLKYKDKYMFMKGLRDIVENYSFHSKEIKLLIDTEEEKTIDENMKNLLDLLIENINLLILEKNYTDALISINEGIDIVGFDRDLIEIKSKVLKIMNRKEEAYRCEIDLILYS